MASLNVYTKEKIDELLSAKLTAASDTITNLENKIATKQDKLTFDGTYNSSTNKTATVSSITSRINALDVTDTAVSGQWVTAVSETDGKINVTRSAITKATLGLGSVVNAGQDTTVTSGSSNYITSGAVKSYVDSAVGAVSQFKYEVVSTLPTASSSTMGKIYLVKDKHSDTDVYDEYITLNTDSEYSWEKLGNTDIDLSGYQTKLTTTQLNAVNSGITASKVSIYDGYASTIASKQGQLSTTQLEAVNSGITSSDVETIQNAVAVSYDETNGLITLTFGE